MTVHHIADYLTQAESEQLESRLWAQHIDLPCDVEPIENNLRPDGTEIMSTLETKGKEPA